MTEIVHVFIVASKGIPAKYGGFETFVENLTKGKMNDSIKYHVSCMNNDEKHFEYNGADCFNVRVPAPGAAGRILHVGLVLKQVEKWIRENNAENVIVYILGCRIGPLLIPHSRKLHSLGARIFCNPDGLEWKRDKWNKAEKMFLRYCEKCLVTCSDTVICDSKNIEKYILETYPCMKGKTTYIAYGAEVYDSSCSEREFDEWCKEHDVKSMQYYLIVGRFVPENNYETMLREYTRCKSKKDLVIVTNFTHGKFSEELIKHTNFADDSRIKFVGTVYDQTLLRNIRQFAYGYIHGHEVGGTNPSLLEALGCTKVNLLLDVGFNREVADDAALYWNKQCGDLAKLITKCDDLAIDDIERYGDKSKAIIKNSFSWKKICSYYERMFIE